MPIHKLRRNKFGCPILILILIVVQHICTVARVLVIDVTRPTRALSRRSRLEEMTLIDEALDVLYV